MSNFSYYTPTHVYFGKDTHKQVGDLVRAQGCKKVLIHFGGQSARRSGLLDQIEASLNAANVAHVQLGGVVPNPHLSLVYQGIDLCKKEGVDFILAVGGGSVIDSAKAIGYGMCMDGDVWDLYDHKLGMGVDYIEIDVQLTRDRQAVIFHDMALEERTPLHGHIRDYTVAELKAAFEIDTLEEALAWCKAHGMAVLLEVKSCELLMHEDMPTLAQRIVEALQKADFFDQCVVFGVNHWILREVCRLDSRCKIALIVPHVPDDPVALMRHMGASSITLAAR